MCVFRWIRRPRDLCIQSGKVLSERQAQYAALNTHSYAYTRSCKVCCLGRDTRHVIAGDTGGERAERSSLLLPSPPLPSPPLLSSPPLPSPPLLSPPLSSPVLLPRSLPSPHHPSQHRTSQNFVRRGPRRGSGSFPAFCSRTVKVVNHPPIVQSRDSAVAQPHRTMPRRGKSGLKVANSLKITRYIEVPGYRKLRLRQVVAPRK